MKIINTIALSKRIIIHVRNSLLREKQFSLPR